MPRLRRLVIDGNEKEGRQVAGEGYVLTIVIECSEDDLPDMMSILGSFGEGDDGGGE